MKRPAVQVVRVFGLPSALNASFCFPGLVALRLDAAGCLAALRALSVDEAWRSSCEAGLEAWNTAHADHADHVRGLVVTEDSGAAETSSDKKPVRRLF